MPPSLSSLLTVADIEAASLSTLSDTAKAHVFAFAGTGSGVLGAQHDRQTFELIRFRPRICCNISGATTHTKILGIESSMPVFIAPIAGIHLAHPEGESVAARAAANVGIPYTCPANSIVHRDELAATSHGPLFYQLYTNESTTRAELAACLRDIERAGYSAVVLTCENPVVPVRHAAVSFREKLEDLDNGEDFPLTPHNAARRPLDWSTVKFIADSTDLPLVVKGVQTFEDARSAVANGARGIYLSNHGARMLDSAPSSIETLLEIRRHCPEILQQAEILCDGAYECGQDVVKALCLGATAVGFGRTVMCAAAVGGRAGIESMLSILKSEIGDTMALLGAHSVSELTARHVNVRRLLPFVSQ